MGDPEREGITTGAKFGVATDLLPASRLARQPGRGKWMALTAALLGWLFDGFEMGLFPVISRPALIDLLGFTGLDMHQEGRENHIALWNSLAIAAFLVGAATGGVLFGWLGDRLGRVRAKIGRASCRKRGE